MLLLPTGPAGSAATDGGDFKLKLKVRKSAGEGRGREGRLYCLHGRQSLSREGKVMELPADSYVRRLATGAEEANGWESRDGLCPSRAFPRQPPTTPADDRAGKSQDTLSELAARSIPNTIPETVDDAESSAVESAASTRGEHRRQPAERRPKPNNPRSSTLDRIAEDPLDRISHANTYGTELEPGRRLTEAFTDTAEKEKEGDEIKEDQDERVVREYVHIVVPRTSSGRAAGKGKRVSWQQQQGDDSTTDFTRKCLAR